MKKKVKYVTVIDRNKCLKHIKLSISLNIITMFSRENFGGRLSTRQKIDIFIPNHIGVNARGGGAS